MAIGVSVLFSLDFPVCVAIAVAVRAVAVAGTISVSVAEAIGFQLSTSLAAFVASLVEIGK